MKRLRILAGVGAVVLGVTLLLAFSVRAKKPADLFVTIGILPETHSEAITRAQIARVLSLGLKMKGYQPAGEVRAFADQSKIPRWAAVDVQRVHQAGLITGFADGTFGPEHSASRGEAAAMVRRLWELLQ